MARKNGGLLASPATLTSVVLRERRDEGQRRDHIADAQRDDRDQRRPRDDLLRVLGLLRVVRDRLEPDPRPEGQEQADAGGEAGARVASLNMFSDWNWMPSALLPPLPKTTRSKIARMIDLADQRGAEDLHRQLDVRSSRAR